MGPVKNTRTRCNVIDSSAIIYEKKKKKIWWRWNIRQRNYRNGPSDLACLNDLGIIRELIPHRPSSSIPSSGRCFLQNGF